MLLRTIVIRAGLLLAMLPVHAGQAATGFNWDNWAAAVNSSPCQWFSTEQLQTLLGEAVSATSSNSATQSQCRFSAADGRLLLSATVHSFKDADAVQSELSAQQQQLEHSAGGRFAQVDTPQDAVTAILRNDRLRLSIFANNPGESVMISLNGHPVLRETEGQQAVRKARLLKFAGAVFQRFQF